MLILSGQRSQACHPTSYNAQGSQAPTINHYLTLTVCSEEVKKSFIIRSCPLLDRALAIGIPNEHFRQN